MGWYEVPKVRNIRELRNYLTDTSNINSDFSVLDSAIKKDHIWILFKTPRNIVTAQCNFVDKISNEIIYNNMDIAECPLVFDIPKNWLGKLTPLDEREKILKQNFPCLRDWFEGVSKWNDKEMEVEFE